jgi:hypothetical protein
MAVKGAAAWRRKRQIMAPAPWHGSSLQDDDFLPKYYTTFWKILGATMIDVNVCMTRQ